MPQMSPYNWMILFIMFNIIMFFVISFNHFMFKYNKKYPNKINKILFKLMW